MKRRFFLLLLFMTGIISCVSLVSILHFVDPYEHTILAVLAISLSFLGAVIWIFSVFLYFIKKIYYRWEVTNMHISTSMRQSCFMWLTYIAYLVLLYFSIPFFIPLLGIVLFFISFELFLQSLYYPY